jgi:hypothetical protein
MPGKSREQIQLKKSQWVATVVGKIPSSSKNVGIRTGYLKFAVITNPATAASKQKEIRN